MIKTDYKEKNKYEETKWDNFWITKWCSAVIVTFISTPQSTFLREKIMYQRIIQSLRDQFNIDK